MSRARLPATAVISICILILSACASQTAEPTEVTSTVTASQTERATAVATPTSQAEPEATVETDTQAQEAEAAAPSDDDAASENVDSGQWDEGPITFKSASLHGNATASGEPFDKDSLTAAHKDLPFDTEVTVINLFNGKRTVVRINDRLPANVSAVIDISPAAAEAIDMIDSGIVDGRIEW